MENGTTEIGKRKTETANFLLFALNRNKNGGLFSLDFLFFFVFTQLFKYFDESELQATAGFKISAVAHCAYCHSPL
jgi:hypothetical protein